MCRSNPPPPTDPFAASAASQAGNVQTATAQSILGNANVYGPHGQTIFNQIGREQIKDAQGNLIDVPRWESRTTLSPAQQAIYDEQNAARLGLTQFANQQIDRLGNVLGAPLDLAHLPKGGVLPTTGPQFTGLNAGPDFAGLADSPAFARLTGAGLPIQKKLQLGEVRPVGELTMADTRFAGTGAVDQTVGPTDFSRDRQAVMQAMRAEAEPGFKQREAALAASLEAQGFRRGTEAFNRAMGDMSDARNRFELGVQQAGGAEQSRLAGLTFQKFGLEGAANQRAYDQAFGRGAFARDSVNMNNAANVAEFQSRLAAVQANNAARTGEGMFANQAQAQAFGQRGQMAGFNNAADQAAYENAVRQTQYGNQMGQQEAQNDWNRTMYGNQNAQQAFGNATNLAIQQNQFRQAALLEQLGIRNQATNEVGALLGTGQVSLPGQVNYTGGQIAPTNVGANMFASNAQQQQQWQQQQQNTNAMIGGLAGIVGTGIQGGMQFGWPGTGTNFFGMQRA